MEKLTNPPNFGFTGRLGSGKTTAAEYLRDRFGYVILGFGQLVRDELYEMGNEDPTREEQQYHGTEVRRAEDPDYWCKKMETAVINNTLPVIVDGIRFPNEWQMAKENNLVLCRFVADREKRALRSKQAGRLTDEAALDHSSETAVDGYHFDHIIYNQGSKEDLYERIIEVVHYELCRT